jgi:hypothetical protein
MLWGQGDRPACPPPRPALWLITSFSISFSTGFWDGILRLSCTATSTDDDGGYMNLFSITLLFLGSRHGMNCIRSVATCRISWRLYSLSMTTWIALISHWHVSFHQARCVVTITKCRIFNICPARRRRRVPVCPLPVPIPLLYRVVCSASSEFLVLPLLLPTKEKILCLLFHL